MEDVHGLLDQQDGFIVHLIQDPSLLPEELVLVVLGPGMLYIYIHNRIRICSNSINLQDTVFCSLFHQNVY